jgi:hypothetical protein
MSLQGLNDEQHWRSPTTRVHYAVTPMRSRALHTSAAGLRENSSAGPGLPRLFIDKISI